MKLFTLLLVFITAAFYAPAQESCSSLLGGHDVNTDAWLFGDKVNVRAAPSPSGEVTDNLPIATRISIIGSESALHSVNGFTDQWYKVEYNSGEKTKNGYVWGGLIALSGSYINVDGYGKCTLVYGVTGFTGSRYQSALKIVSNGKIICSTQFETITSGFEAEARLAHAVCVDVLPGHTLSGVRNVIKISFDYPACGYTNGDILVFFTGNTLVYAFKALRVSEAGIFNVSYDIIFPDEEGGKKDAVILKTTSREYNEDMSGFSDDIRVNEYIWDGQSVKEMNPENK